MRRQYVGLILVAVILFAGSLGYVGVGEHLYGEYRTAFAAYQFAPTGPCDALIAWSPPAVIYSAFYVNQPSLVSLSYRSPDPQTLRLTVSIPHFTVEQSIQVRAVPGMQQQVFKPPLISAGILDSFASQDQIASEIHLKVQSSSGVVCDTSTPVIIKSRDWMHWYNASSDVNNRYLAGWVTPYAPAIQTLMGRTAQWLQAHPESYVGTSVLNGYDAGQATQQDVVNQVDAIYDTLQNVYGLRYVVDNVPYDRDERIQLPQDILSEKAPSGMCLETTVLMASAVEYLGMRPYIIIVPGHAFLGVALGADAGAPIAYWETSDLDTGANGAQANIHGQNEYASARADGKLLGIVDVQYERQQGIEPIE